MLRVLRRCRTLALTLLLAAPGLGGTWLSLAHPCPVDMPWLARSEHGEQVGQSQHGHHDTPDGSSGSCSCVSACQGGSAALSSSPARPTVSLVSAGWDASPAVPDSQAPVQRTPHRHPPSTAPPLA